MNCISQLGLPITIEVNYPPGLFVGMTVYDDSGSAPVQLGSLIPMTAVIDTLYRAKHTPQSGNRSYIYRKAVYTDNTYTTLSPNYARSSESVQVIDFAAFVPAQTTPIVSFTATISPPPSLVAVINDAEPLMAYATR